jgi:hypothetical protein
MANEDRFLLAVEGIHSQGPREITLAVEVYTPQLAIKV